MKKVKNNATWRLEDQEWWQKYSASLREEDAKREEAARQQALVQNDANGVQSAAEAPQDVWSAVSCESEVQADPVCGNEPAKPAKNNADWRLEDQGWWKKYHAAVMEMQSSQLMNDAGVAGAGIGSGSFDTSGSGSGSGSGICAQGYGLGLI